MEQNRYLVGPAYLVAMTLILVPLFDAATQLGGFNPGSNQWRFGAVGLMSNAFLIPAVGLLITLAAALHYQHRWVLRSLGVLCGLGAGLVTVTLLMFLLDAVETRATVQPQVKFAFTVASITAALKLVVAIATMALIARAGWRGAPGKRSAKRQARAPMVAVPASPPSP